MGLNCSDELQARELLNKINIHLKANEILQKNRSDWENSVPNSYMMIEGTGYLIRVKVDTTSQ